MHVLSVLEPKCRENEGRVAWGLGLEQGPTPGKTAGWMTQPAPFPPTLVALQQTVGDRAETADV